MGRGEGLRRGVGFAVGYKNIAYSEGFDDFSEARVTLSVGMDGPVAELHCAAAEVGQGVHTILGQIAREALGVESVVLRPSDTQIGSAGSSSASRQTVMSGGAVLEACRAVREELLRRARTRAEQSGQRFEGDLALEDGHVVADGAPIAPIADLLTEPIERTRQFHHRPTDPPPSGPSSRSTLIWDWSAWCRSLPPRTWDGPSTPRASADRSKEGRLRGSVWRCSRRFRWWTEGSGTRRSPTI